MSDIVWWRNEDQKCLTGREEPVQLILTKYNFLRINENIMTKNSHTPLQQIERHSIRLCLQANGSEVSIRSPPNIH